MSDDAWFYAEGDEQRGPVPLIELRSALRRLPPDTQVWREGMAEWTSASLVPELRSATAGRTAPPPLRPGPRPAPPSSGSGAKVALWVGIAVVVLFVGVAVLGIVAAIAIPSLLRARVSANESATIGDIRTVISAQYAYQSSNGGAFAGDLECLVTPSGCIEGYPPTAPTFLDRILLEQMKSGYRRSFEAGPIVSGPGNGRSSVRSWAFVAVPVTANTTGVRSFCGDSSGIVCASSTGADDLVDTSGDEPSCAPERCQPLR